MFPPSLTQSVPRPRTTRSRCAGLPLFRARGRSGRVLVAEVRGVVAAAISRDELRTIADPALAPAYLTAILRLRANALAAVARQPSLAERMREAVLGTRESEQLPLAA